MTAGRTVIGTEEAMESARALTTCTALLSRALGRALARWDLTWPQAMSLLLLRTRDEPTNATWLVGQLGLGRTAMTAVVDRLERRGWVRRRPHPHDRRVALLELTDEGRRVADEARAGVTTAAEALVQRARLPARFDTATIRLTSRAR